MKYNPPKLEKLGDASSAFGKEPREEWKALKTFLKVLCVVLVGIYMLHTALEWLLDGLVGH
jgi:hypothetical protein